MQWIEGAENGLEATVRALRLALEAVGAFWIGVGFVFTMAQLLVAHVRRHIASFTRIRLTFGRYLSLALEFQLASDILSTSVAPSWTAIGKLGATAVIRTALNFFLTREISDYMEREERDGPRFAGPVDPQQQDNV
jgi:uncharacterized membrane protein